MLHQSLRAQGTLHLSAHLAERPELRQGSSGGTAVHGHSILPHLRHLLLTAAAMPTDEASSLLGCERPSPLQQAAAAVLLFHNIHI
jgi:hypothetical protein